MDQQLVRDLREQVADILSRQRREDADNGLAADVGRGRAAVRPRRHRPGPRRATPATRSRAGRTPPTPTEEQELADGIHAALFGVGRLQPLLDDPEVENIDINGCDQVFVGYADGREERAEPVAESDEELIELVQIARRLLRPDQPPVRHRQPAARPAAARRLAALGGHGRLRAAVALDPARAARRGSRSTCSSATAR